MATATTINTKVSLAVTAIEAGNLATALTYLLSAKALLSAKFDQKSGTTELRYDRAAIDQLIKDVRKQQHAGAGIQTQTIEYIRPTS